MTDEDQAEKIEKRVFFSHEPEKICIKLHLILKRKLIAIDSKRFMTNLTL